MEEVHDRSSGLNIRCSEDFSTLNIPSNLILGCSSLAGLYDAVGDEVANETVKKAIESGFTMFDTAPHYGCGLGEVRLGAALRQHMDGNSTKSMKLWTKVGRVMVPVGDLCPASVEKAVSGRDIDAGNVPGSAGCIFPEAPRDVVPVFDYSNSGVQQSYEDSQKRLGLDKIEGISLHGLRLHDCDTDDKIAAVLGSSHGGVDADGTNPDVTQAEGGLRALVQMRSNGHICDVSIGLNDTAAALTIIRGSLPGSLDSVMIAGCWNLLDHSQECLELFLECQHRGIKVHNAGVYASGLLVGGATYRYQPAPAELIRKTEQWKLLCEEYNVPLPAVAMKFALLPSVVEAIAVGVKNPTEVEQTVSWFRALPTIPDEIFAEARRRGLLEPHVPISN